MSSNVFLSLSLSPSFSICIYVCRCILYTSYEKISPPGSSHFQALSCWFLLMVALCSRPRECPRLRRAITKWYSQRHSGMFDLVLHGKRLVTLRMFTVTSLMITIMNLIRRRNAQEETAMVDRLVFFSTFSTQTSLNHRLATLVLVTKVIAHPVQEPRGKVNNLSAATLPGT